jgi:hypothetical protein
VGEQITDETQVQETVTSLKLWSISLGVPYHVPDVAKIEKTGEGEETNWMKFPQHRERDSTPTLGSSDKE